jgi:hypothetical protein
VKFVLIISAIIFNENSIAGIFKGWNPDLGAMKTIACDSNDIITLFVLVVESL